MNVTTTPSILLPRSADYGQSGGGGQGEAAVAAEIRADWTAIVCLPDAIGVLDRERNFPLEVPRPARPDTIAG